MRPWREALGHRASARLARSEMTSSRVAVVPDLAPIGGSLEHYGHFLLGYLAPLMALLQGAAPGPRELAVVDCGPVLNPLFDFVTGDRLTTVRTLPAGRLAWTTTSGQRVVPFRFDRVHGHDVERLGRARAFALAQLDRHRPCPEAQAAAGRVLVIRRSPSPGFYRPGGAARISGYGTERRAITNTDEVAAALQDAGLPATVFEPGSHSLACQVHAFARAAGVIGQRGADLANVVWMAPPHVLVMLNPRPMAALPPVVASIAGVLEIPSVALPMADLHGAVPEDDVVRACLALLSP